MGEEIANTDELWIGTVFGPQREGRQVTVRISDAEDATPYISLVLQLLGRQIHERYLRPSPVSPPVDTLASCPSQLAGERSCVVLLNLRQPVGNLLNHRAVAFQDTNCFFPLVEKAVD